MNGHGSTYVLFRLGEEHYGLPVSSVVSIIRYKAPTPVPRASEAVLGVVNLRGRILPVVDLGRRFSGRAFEPKSSSRIVVTEGAGGVVGIAVDLASEVATFGDESVRPVPDSVLSSETMHAFVGMVERPSGLVMLLDPEEAVPQHEYQRVATEAYNGLSEEGTDVQDDPRR
jgi:purine-binding chemotaxis protein CheW